MRIGRRSQVRLIRPSDYEALYAFSTLNASVGWRHGSTTPSPEATVSSIWQNALFNVAVEDNAGCLLGFCFTYNPDFRNGNCWFAVLGNTLDPASYLMLSGALLAIDHIFEVFPIDRIYIEASEASAAQFSSMLRYPLECEAVFKGFYRSGLGRTDKFVYALRSDNYLAWRLSDGADL